MTIYQTDDLGFDLEIRGNIFVNTQLYPSQKKVIISFLEELTNIPTENPHHKSSISNINTPTSTATSSSSELTRKQQEMIALGARIDSPIVQDLGKKHKKKPTLDSKIADKNASWSFLQKYYDNSTKSNLDYRVESRQDNLAIIKDKIYETVPQLKDFTIEFENLNILPDFLKFAKRYGVSAGKQLNPNFANKKLLYNHTKIKQKLGAYHIVYDTDDDYDANKHGLRIGYNSSNYDETFIANMLGNLMFNNPNRSPIYLDILLNNATDPARIKHIKEKQQKIFHDKIFETDTKTFRPSNLVHFNNQMFAEVNDPNSDHKGYMPNALGKPWEENAGSLTRDSWERSNRFVDISKLNPKRISLKRCAMALGYKIQESSTNRDPTAPLESLDEIAELMAYNVNDTYVTLKIFESGSYYNRYQQNRQLLSEFPYLVYDQLSPAQQHKAGKKIIYRVDQDNVRQKRLTINSTSTQLVENTIAPYPNTKIQDNKTLNLNYPDAKIAKQLNQAGKLPQEFHGRSQNALDYIQSLLDQDLKQTDKKTATKVQTQYDKIKAFYNQFIGKNLNEEMESEDNPLLETKSLPIKGALVRYITPHGTYQDQHGDKKYGTASYVYISLGGTHGAEVNQDAFDQDLSRFKRETKLYQDTIDDLNQSGKYDYEVNLDNLAEAITEVAPEVDPETGKKIPFTHIKRTPLPSHPTHTYGDLLTSSASRKKPRLKNLKEPKLFNASKVKASYSYTSSAFANHEDFDSYYPSLISQLAIFRNVDGNDVFTDDLYHPRLKMKKQSKDKSLDEKVRQSYAFRQNSMKLLINSASGGGDASFNSNIKCNNKMVAMRIIGQLFCWYIGQSLALHDARIPSTNTDGLYSMNIEPELNNQIVIDRASKLLLKIDPEPLTLFVSKDTNTRLEKDGNEIANARGGGLTSWQGPSTDNSIAHPAIIDYVLAQYFNQKPDAVFQDFDRELAKNIMHDFMYQGTKFNQKASDTLRFLQFPIVANANTGRFPYKASLEDPNKIEYLNATNRVFLVKPHTSENTIKMSGLQSIQKPTANKRNKERNQNEHLIGTSFRDLINIDPLANEVIKENATPKFYKQLLDRTVTTQTYAKGAEPSDKPRDISSIKISDLPLDQPIEIYNEDLHDITKEDYNNLLDKIDADVYLDVVQNKFEDLWANV